MRCLAPETSRRANGVSRGIPPSLPQGARSSLRAPGRSSPVSEAPVFLIKDQLERFLELCAARWSARKRDHGIR